MQTSGSWSNVSTVGRFRTLWPEKISPAGYRILGPAAIERAADLYREASRSPLLAVSFKSTRVRFGPLYSDLGEDARLSWTGEITLNTKCDGDFSVFSTWF